MLWPGTAAVLGVQFSTSGQKVRPGAGGEKRVEDVLPSWRSTQSLAVKETAVRLRSGSLTSGRNFEVILFLADVRVKENRKMLLCKTSGGIIRLPDKRLPVKSY